VVAGEPSGDIAAAQVVARTNARRPCRFFGVGGDALCEQGVSLVSHIRDLTALGIRGTAERFGRWARAWVEVREAIAKRRPAAALLVDAPEVNLPLARVAKAAGAGVVYYIGPQVWAWRKQRLALLKDRTDAVALVLPFEKPLYDAEGVAAAFVGHPILDFAPRLSPEVIATRLGIDRKRPVAAMLPGSRQTELTRHSDPMIGAGERLAKRDIQVVVAISPALRSPGLLRRVAEAGLKSLPWDLPVRELFQVADAAIVASGTATLEAAVAGVPMAVVYRVDRLSFAAGQILFGIPFVALPNWVAGRRVVPELLQDDVTPDRLHGAALRLLEPEERSRQKAELAAVARALGAPGAADRVAKLLLGQLA
jgi:lipid-A-disaccharide synthase